MRALCWSCERELQYVWINLPTVSDTDSEPSMDSCRLGTLRVGYAAKVPHQAPPRGPRSRSALALKIMNDGCVILGPKAALRGAAASAELRRCRQRPARRPVQRTASLGSPSPGAARARAHICRRFSVRCPELVQSAYRRWAGSICYRPRPRITQLQRLWMAARHRWCWRHSREVSLSAPEVRRI